ncbi:helix-turn-helix domain-containing protein [Ectobacillus funiculus]|uniref:helix-turn-helix domain-containing protein n=1 Tax=Ectobacillus funiculus TaxID=137993 RepID=UPI00397C9901
MLDLTTIQKFLNEKFEDIPYCVWLGKPNALELCLTNGKTSIAYPPDTSDLNKQNNYTFLQQDNKTYMVITFEDNFQIIICFLDNTHIFNDYELDYLYLLFSGLYYKEIYRTNNNELDKMIESAQIITSTLDINELLKKIIQIALTVIPVGDAGVFRLFDDKTNSLVPLAIVGLRNDYYEYKTKIGENISGMVFSDRIPRIYQSKEEIMLGHENCSKEHLNYIKNSVIAEAMIVVPVLFEEKCIGTMAILQFSKNGHFVERHLRLLQGFASQVAIAYNNAKLYKEAQMRLKTVMELSAELGEKNQLLQKRIHVHDTLTQLSLKNKGIKKIVDETNRILNIPVGYIDFLDNEVYSGRNSQLNIDFDTISQLISNQQSSPFFNEIHNQKYYFYPIIVGTVLLSCIIIKFSEPLSQMDIVTIEQSASVISLELVKKISLTELHYKKAHEYFNQILEKPDDESLISAGNQFNFKFSSHSFVVLCEIPGSIEPYKAEARIQRLLLKINQAFSDINKLVYGFHNKVTILFSIDDITYVNKIIYQLEIIVKEWERTEKESLCGGIGTSYRNIEDIVKSYNEANKAISFLTSRNKLGIIRYENIGINRFFLNHSNQEIEKFTEEIFSRLRSGKLQSHDLEKTLKLYILSNKSAIETARELNIHINTFYQRLKKIEERLELSFDNPEDMLQIHLACHLKETFI